MGEYRDNSLIGLWDTRDYPLAVTMGLWASFNVLLVDEGILGAVYLAALGQPLSL